MSNTPDITAGGIGASASAGIAIAAAIAAFALTACGNKDAGTAAANTSPPAPMQVTVKRMEPQKVPVVLEAVGQAEGSREVEIRPRVSGILEKRLYSEGATVRAGQTLFEIDRAPFEIAVAQAQAAVEQERARQELAERESDRLKPLADTKAISRREYDQAAAGAKGAAAAIAGAQAKLAEARLNLSYTNLKAPIGGVTSMSVRSEGSLVAANTDLLTTITQVNPIWVRFSLAEADFDRIRANAAGADVSIVDANDAIVAKNGRLNFAGSTVDPKLGTVQLRAEFPNADQKWLPGRFLKLRVVAGSQDAFLVPQAAIVQTEKSRNVWIAGSDGKVAMRVVDTGGWFGADWIVTKGLAPGDLVVTDNLIKLRAGAAVDARPAGAAASPPPASGEKGVTPSAPAAKS